MTIGWDYEETTESYYHIYACGALGELMNAITILLPRTEENDRDIQQIVDLLKKIESRMTPNTVYGDKEHEK